jgi:hypothetical protein
MSHSMRGFRISIGNLSGFRHSLGACIGKKIYPSTEIAERSIKQLTDNNAHRPFLGRLEPYECRKCGRIHIGHVR